ncbi:DUF5688 family protein [Roseburia hominis]
MKYEDFIERMLQEVKKRVESDVSITLHTATKNNGAIRKGFVFEKHKNHTAPIIYLDEFYESYQHGREVEELAGIMCMLYKKAIYEIKPDFERVIDYEEMKDRIVYQLINAEKNKDLLAEIPYKKFHDLAIVFYLLLEKSGDETATMLIKDELLQRWGVSEQEVYENAVHNTPVLFPMEINPLTDSMYVLTNDIIHTGASVILYDDTLKRAADVIKTNFYLIPSSIHEWILVPDDGVMTRSHLEGMVDEVNADMIPDTEILGDCVYYYSIKEGRLIV